jgi:hypothetical protein
VNLKPYGRPPLPFYHYLKSINSSDPIHDPIPNSHVPREENVNPSPKGNRDHNPALFAQPKGRRMLELADNLTSQEPPRQGGFRSGSGEEFFCRRFLHELAFMQVDSRSRKRTRNQDENEGQDGCQNVGYRLDIVEKLGGLPREISAAVTTNDFFSAREPRSTTLRPLLCTSWGAITGLSPNLATWIRDDGRPFIRHAG